MIIFPVQICFYKIAIEVIAGKCWEGGCGCLNDAIGEIYVCVEMPDTLKNSNACNKANRKILLVLYSVGYYPVCCLKYFAEEKLVPQMQLICYITPAS